MGKEIERKFLVKSDVYKSLAQGTHYQQGYIPTVNGMTVRIRIAGEKAFITLKTRALGITRHEFEYPMPPLLKATRVYAGRSMNSSATTKA